MRKRLTYANVMVTILAVVVIGGGTVAVASSDNSQDRTIAKAVVNGRLDGLSVKKVFFKGGPNTTPKSVLNVAGLKLKVGCDAGPVTIAKVTSATNAVSLQGESSGYPKTGSDDPERYNDFEAFANENILGDHQHGSGVLVYSTLGGRIVTMVYGFDDAVTYGDRNLCTFRATAITG
jgi:hypothetical protein